MKNDDISLHSSFWKRNNFLDWISNIIKHLIFHDVTQVLILNPDIFALQRFPFNLFHLDGSDLQFLHCHPDHQLRDGLEQYADCVLIRSSMLTFSGLLETLNLVGGFCQTTSQKTSSSAHVRWFHSIFLDQKQLHFGGELLGDFSCTTTCFGAVIGQERIISILILHYIS